MKVCLGCQEVKSIDQFHLKRGKPQARCKVCRSQYMAEKYAANREVEMTKRKAWYEKNKLRISEKGKAERLANPGKGNLERRLSKYRITKDQYLGRLKEQENLCALCINPFITTPAIDHCHTTNAFRGLLCDNCNTGFGLLKESIANFERCIAYARKYKK